MNAMRRQLLLLLVGTSLAGSVFAQAVAEESAGVTWCELGPQQQQVFRSF